MKFLVAALLFCTSTASAQDLLVVGNKADADVSIIEVGSGRTVKRIPTGVGPHEVAVSPNGKLAVVANYGTGPAPGNTLTVIDATTLEVMRTVSLGAFTRPHGIAFMPDNRRVVVTSEASRSIVVADVVDNTVLGSIATDQQGTHMVSVRADGRRAFTANIGSGTWTELDLDHQRLVQTVQVAPQAEAIGLSPDGKELWVGSNQDGTVSIFEVATGARIATLEAPGVPIRVYFSPDGKRALVSSAQASVVRFFDAAERKQAGEIAVEGTPIGAVFSPDGKFAYVALTAKNAIAVLDLEAMKVVGSYATGNTPDALAYLKRQ